MSQKPKRKQFFIFKKKDQSELEVAGTGAPDAQATPPSPSYFKHTSPSAAKIFSASISRKSKRFSASGLHELVQCPLCLEKFYNAKMLPCQHTFCLACLKAHTAGKTFLECPICSVKFALTSQNALDNLPSNLYIDSLLQLVSGGSGVTAEELQAVAAPPGTPRAEVPCDLFAAGVRCSNCKTMSDSSATTCCNHCKLDFCGLCWRQHMDELKSQIGSILKQMESASSRLEHKLENFKDRCERLREQINAATEDKINAILDEKEALLKEAADIERTGDMTALALRTSVGEALETVAKSTNADESLDSMKTDNEKVGIYLNLHQNALQIMNDVAKWDEQKFVFDKEKFRIDADIATPSEAESEEPLPFGNRENNPLENEENLVMHYRSRNFVPHYVWRKTPRPGGIGMSPWTNHLYVCGMDTHSVLVVERTHAKIVGRLTCEEMLCPTHIAFMKGTGEIFVTDKWKHCVHAFSKDGEYLRSLGQKGSRLGTFRSPEGIATDNSQNLIYVVDTGNDRVQILEPDGKYVGQIGMVTKPVPSVHSGGAWESHDTECTELNTPTSIALSADRVVILDSGNRRVKVYSKHDRAKMFEFGSLGQRKGQFRQPEVLTLDPLGFILVGDSGNSRVQVFKPSGQLVRVFGGLGQQPGKFGWISGIFVTKELDIIISDTKNHCVNFI